MRTNIKRLAEVRSNSVPDESRWACHESRWQLTNAIYLQSREDGEQSPFRPSSARTLYWRRFRLACSRSSTSASRR